MNIANYLKEADYYTYEKLNNLCKENKDIELGDKPENLMKHDCHKRVKGRIRQIRWS